MLRALLEREIVPDLVLGTSIGAVNGAIVAHRPDVSVIGRLTELWQSASSERDSGYGDKPLLNPHHRFWAHQARADFPTAPPGILSGGPNSDLQDPYVQAAGLKKKGCAPQKCFLDNIEAWSVNEITINWNSPLAWVTSFLDEQGR